MSRRSPAGLTLAVQRLNSAHGRLVHAAWRVPARNRYLPAAAGPLAAVEVLAHLLEFQDEALRRLSAISAPASSAFPLGAGEELAAAASSTELRRHSWEVLMERLETGHLELCRRLGSEPPEWFGDLTYEHYARHIPDLEAWHASAARG